MDETRDTTTSRDFRGLTIFELLLIGVVVLGSILWALSVRAGMNSKVYDEQKKARVSTLKENLMSVVEKDGSFPSQDQFQNEDKRKLLFSTFLGDYGSDSLTDPTDKERLITYVAEPEGCAPDTDNPCTKFTVALQLSSGEWFTKFGIKPGKELEYLQETTQDQTTNDLGPEN